MEFIQAFKVAIVRPLPEAGLKASTAAGLRYLSTGRTCRVIDCPVQLPRAHALEDWTLEAIQTSYLPDTGKTPDEFTHSFG